MGKVKWWLLCPSNLLLWEYGSTSGFNEQRNDGCFVRATYCGEGGALWFDCSLVIITGRNDRVNLSLQLCTQYCCTAGGAGWRMSHMSAVPCRRNEVELFLALISILQDLFICTHNFNEIVLWCYEGFNFGSRRKKRFQLRIHVSCLEIISLQHSIKYKWNYHG